MSSSSVNWLAHYDDQIIKTDEWDTFQCPTRRSFKQSETSHLKPCLEKKNSSKDPTSTTGPSLWRQRYDYCCLSTWGFYMDCIVYKHPATYTFHTELSTNISWTPILFKFLIICFTYIQCNPIVYLHQFVPRGILFNLTTRKFIWTKHILLFNSFLHHFSPIF